MAGQVCGVAWCCRFPARTAWAPCRRLRLRGFPMASFAAAGSIGDRGCHGVREERIQARWHPAMRAPGSERPVLGPLAACRHRARASVLRVLLSTRRGTAVSVSRSTQEDAMGTGEGMRGSDATCLRAWARRCARAGFPAPPHLGRTCRSAVRRLRSHAGGGGRGLAGDRVAGTPARVAAGPAQDHVAAVDRAGVRHPTGRPGRIRPAATVSTERSGPGGKSAFHNTHRTAAAQRAVR